MRYTVSVLVIVAIGILAGCADSSGAHNSQATPGLRSDVKQFGGGTTDPAKVFTFTGESDFLPLNRWRVVNKQGGVVPDTVRGRKGFRFLAEPTSSDQVGRDYAWTQWEPGTDVWDLSFRLDIDKKKGRKHPGVWIGISTAPPGRMGENDATVLVRVSMNGVHAEVTRGEVYELVEGESGDTSFGQQTLFQSDKGRKNLGAVKSGMSRIVQIRRDGDVFRFSIYSGERKRGTSPAKTVHWNVPENMDEFDPACLIIKRIPHKGKSRKNANWRLSGAVANIRGRLKPPGMREVELGKGVLGEGSQIVLSAELLTNKSRVYVGDEKAKAAATDIDDRWRITLPKLKRGAHDLVVEQPNGLWSMMPDAVPIGRFLRSVEPIEGSVEGGDSVTLHGGGFDRDTVVYFGRKKVKGLNVHDSATMTVRAPAGKEGTVQIHCEAEDSKFEGTVDFGRVDHPYMFFDARELKKLREDCRKPPLKPYLDALLKKARTRRASDGGNNSESTLTTNPKILAWAYALTGDGKYGEQLKKWMHETWNERNVYDFQLSSAGMMAFSYDLMFNELTKRERIKTQEYLVAVLDKYIEESRKHRWFFTNTSNTNPVANSGAGLCALALMHSDPRTDYVLDFAKHWCLDYASRTMGPDGSCVEGRLYWAYGLGHYLLFADALRNATGDSSLLDHEHVKNNHQFVEAMVGGHREEFLLWNDDFPKVADSAICALLGSYYGQEFMIKMADRHPGRSRMRGFDLLWRSRYEKRVSETPLSLPTLAVLPNINWGIMRSDGSTDPALVVGLKGSEGPTTHHKHKDGGSFVLHARGQRVLVDTGYWGRDHSVVRIGGKGPARSGAVITDTYESGDMRAAVIDSTRAFHRRAERVRRNIAMVGKRWVVILDEVRPVPEMRSKVKLRFIGGWPKSEKPEESTEQIGPKKVDARSFLLQHRKSNTKLTFHGAGGLKQTAASSKFFSRCIGIDVPVDQFDQPVITVIQIIEPDAELHAAKVERTNRRVTVSLPDSKKLTYRKTRAGWGLALNGKTLASSPEYPYERRSVVCHKTDNAPKIDAKADDVAWKKAEAADNWVACWAWHDGAPRYPAMVWLRWDERNLYFLAKCNDASEEDDFQFMLDPEMDGETLYRLEFSSDGKLNKGAWGSRNTFDAEVEWKAEVRGGTRIIEARLPWKGFEIKPPAAGSIFKLNFIRYRAEGIQKTSVQWSPTRGYANDSTLFYGDLKLREKK